MHGWIWKLHIGIEALGWGFSIDKIRRGSTRDSKAESRNAYPIVCKESRTSSQKKIKKSHLSRLNGNNCQLAVL